MQERVPSVSVCVSWLEERIVQQHPRTRFQRFHADSQRRYTGSPLAEPPPQMNGGSLLLFVCREKKKCKSFNQVKAGI